MRIGIMTMKPMKKHKGQFIGTQFIVLGVPLIPLRSVFFTGEFSDKGIPIGFYWKQVLKIYMIFICLIGVFVVIGFSHEKYLISSKITAQWLIALCIILGLYFAFLFGRMNEEEKELRDLYGQAMDLNALPEYMSRSRARAVQKALISKFEEMFSENWEQVLDQKKYNKEHIPFLFTILGYQKRIYNEARYQNLYLHIHEEYKRFSI
jgi:hypothetical protein